RQSEPPHSADAVVEGAGLDVTEDEETGGVTIDVDFASEAETVAGEVSDKSVHPAGLSAALVDQRNSAESRATSLLARR
ncbi:MAG: hypothetical protein KAG89_12280, partial [Fulvimarina manganoxydans]|uniref:hypothetical protein n=1 Tax=Fulvimarina manganoxydans TaxID=937218 RepID=UPI002355C120